MPKIVYAHLLAHQPEYAVRPVTIPDDRLLAVPKIESQSDADYMLELAFHFGQNDFQPLERLVSVSMGDVLDIGDGKLYICKPFGFGEISHADFEAYKLVPRRDRTINVLVRGTDE